MPTPGNTELSSELNRTLELSGDKESPDLFEHDVSKLWQAERYRVARSAVLTPLYGLNWAKSKAGTIAAMQKLIKWNRTRLVDLRINGLPRTQKAKQFGFTLNCPPFSVGGRKFAKPCNRRMHCPHCYGRRVTEAFIHIEKTLYGDIKSLKPVSGRHTLIAYRRQAYRRHTVEPFGPAVIATALVPDLLGAYLTNRREELNWYGRGADVKASVTMCHFWPNDVTGRVYRETGGVLLIRGSHGNDPPELPNRNIRHWTSPDKADLRDAISWALAYPTAYMASSAANLVAVVGAVGKTRCYYTYGGK